MPLRCETARASSICLARHLQDLVVATGALVAAMIVLAVSVRADESYLCEDGRIVTVRFGELERLARTDACIAGHLARRTRGAGAEASALEAPTSSAANSTSPAIAPNAPSSSTTAVVRAIDADVPPPVRKPVIAVATAEPDNIPRHAATEIIVHYEAPPPADGPLVKPRVEQVVFRRATHHYYSSDPLPEGPVDFRHVPIINAAPGTPGVFHHTR